MKTPLPPPAPKHAALISAISKGFAPAIKQFVGEALEKATKPLIERIAALEQRPELKYLGVHKDGASYSAAAR